jgi:hypothetical protein
MGTAQATFDVVELLEVTWPEVIGPEVTSQKYILRMHMENMEEKSVE